MTLTLALSRATREREYKEFDPLGLYNMRARYYAPYLMRFISPDPLGFGGGDTNLYRYVGNDPVDFTDPSGLKGSSSGGPVGGLDDPSDDRRNRGGKELPTGEQARPNEVDIPGGGQTTPLPLSVQTVFISSGLGGGLNFGGGFPGRGLGSGLSQVQFRVPIPPQLAGPERNFVLCLAHLAEAAGLATEPCFFAGPYAELCQSATLALAAPALGGGVIACVQEHLKETRQRHP
jgi:RHS repeat-associated protein